MLARRESNWEWRWPERKWASSCACVLIEPSPPIRHRGRPEDGRVGMGRNLPVSTQRPGPLLPLSGRPRMHTMGGCDGSRGAGSIPSPTSTPNGAHGKPARSSAGPSSGWKWSIFPDRPKRLGPSGSGGGDRSRRIWKRSGGCTSPGSRSNTPSASANKSSSGRPPSCAHQRRRTAGPGW
jgi:hypothetical protein